MPEPLRVPKKLFCMLKMGHNGLKRPINSLKLSFKMVIFGQFGSFQLHFLTFYDGIIDCYDFLGIIEGA